MNRIDKYFDKLLSLNAVQLSISPETPIKYIMSSGREFNDSVRLSTLEIENMMNEISNDEIDFSNLKDQINIKYEFHEKGIFSGLIGKSGKGIFSSFVLVEKFKTSMEEKEQVSGEETEDEVRSGLDLDVEVKTGEPEIDKYLKLVIKNNGSDLHISSNEYPFIRKDGKLIKVKDLPVLSFSTIEKMIGEIIPEGGKTKLDKNEDLDFAYEIRNYARFRCNIFKDMKGMAAAFRLIPCKIPSLEELDLPDIFKDFCFLNRGLVLVTGPTGSGKSTTLSAIIDFINRKRDIHIITLEDPIEFVHKNIKALINQRELKKHMNSFSNALKSALREDPDVVLIGEMRDLETISIALETAETGHLVFGTLHTTSAYSTVNRIVEQFPPEQQEQIKTMLADSLKAVVTQTLCKKIGGGRVAAFEILLVTSAVSNLIRESKTYQIPSIIQTRKKEGMISLNDYLMFLVNSNMIETYEAYLRAVDKKGIIGMLKAKEYKTDFLSRLDMLE